MSFFRRRSILKKINAPDLIPVRAVGHEEQNGKVVLLPPKFESSFMHRLFPVTRSMFYHIRLDETGSSAWQLMDGNRNLEGIAAMLAPGSPDNGEMLRRLNTFVSMLYERKYILFKQLIEEN